MNTNIADQIRTVLTVGIQSVIEGKKKSFEIKAFRPDTIPVSCELVKDVMAGLGWAWEHKYEDTFSTNGWEYDWWMNFKKGGKSFTASGSGYYGGFGFDETDE